MFQAFDKLSSGRGLSRPDWMALLARAPLPLLESALLPLQSERRTEWLRRPETGLYMVQGRTGGTGERFNLGEVTVTRCALRSVKEDASQAPAGVAYVLGRQHRQAELAALADALLQEGAHQEELVSGLLVSVSQYLAAQKAEKQAQVQSTKVNFFTVAREAGDGADEEEAE
ncbi:phosphonate C-P lyase system protein PhnG [Ottowia sp. VDI28]|uniref:phosphonate C-P lyase system protein PhnG n=1 Tax=Ottowia sp. VDI28 TaxID=3133968 RepID=UPI003C2D8698